MPSRPTIIDESAWRALADAHRERLAVYVEPHQARRRERRPHPVHDFLFTYYQHRPNRLLAWHPGYGVSLAGAWEYADRGGYAVDADGTAPVSAALITEARPAIEALQRVLTATAGRQGHFGCFGLHEWAMVYRQPADHVRHAAWPLRLGGPGTDEVVAGHRIACSHFDAFRFFTDEARPLNALQPHGGQRADFEQPGCLHANMDLYGRVAARLSPMIPSELVADAFELAWDIRTLDMRAAPYDLAGLTLDPEGVPWTPVKIETPEGKREYAEAQRVFAERAAPIRQQLSTWCGRLLAVGRL